MALATPVPAAPASSTAPRLHPSLLTGTPKLPPQDTPQRPEAEHQDLLAPPVSAGSGSRHCPAPPGTIPGTGGPGSHARSAGGAGPGAAPARSAGAAGQQHSTRPASKPRAPERDHSFWVAGSSGCPPGAKSPPTRAPPASRTGQRFPAAATATTRSNTVNLIYPSTLFWLASQAAHSFSSLGSQENSLC